MKTLIAGVVLLAIHLSAPAQELTLRAGELLSCSLEEPNFSSATRRLISRMLPVCNAVRRIRLIDRLPRVFISSCLQSLGLRL